MGLEKLAIWGLNSGLFVLSSYFAASTISLVGGEMLAPAAQETAPPAPAPAAAERTWQSRQVILKRNLFNVSTLAPQPVLPVEEKLQATKLPLRLLGTAASTIPGLSWAAVADLDKRENQVVRIDDRVQGKATVVAIERRRIVLENAGRREELALDEEGAPAKPQRRLQGRSRERLKERRARLADRARKLAEAQKAAPSGAGARNPASLFSQARILPKYEEGEMVGVQLTNVKPGSLFEKIGIQNGDVIVEFNGLEIDSPQQSAEVLREFTEAEEFELVVTGTDKRERTLTYTVEE